MTDNQVASHYSNTKIVDCILAGLERAGIGVDSVSVDDLEPMERYIHYLEGAGFSIEKTVVRGQFAESFFRKMQEAAKNSDGPPAIGLHLLVGPSIKEKMQNFSQAVFDGLVEPTEIIARKL